MTRRHGKRSRRDTTVKANALRVHSDRRAEERMGRRLSDVDRATIERRITDGGARLVERQSLRVAVYLVDLIDGPWCIVWDRNRREVVTVLPRDADLLRPSFADDAEHFYGRGR